MATDHLHPVPDARLSPEAAKVSIAALAVVEVFVVDHLDVVAVVGLGFGDDPRFWARLRLLLLVG